MAGKTTPRAPVLGDIPIELIIEASKSFETCNVRVTRANAKNHWQTILNGDSMPVLELQQIDKYLDELTGGGRYRIEARNPNGVAPVYVVPPFYCNVEGNPRPKPGAGQVPGAGAPPAMAGAPGFGGFQVSAPGFAPQQATGWGAGLAPAQQAGYAAHQGMGPGWQPPWRQRNNGGGQQSFASDQLAMRQVGDMKEMVGKLEGRLQVERDKREQREKEQDRRARETAQRHEREIGEMRRKSEEDKRRADDQRRADERTAQQAQLMQMQQQFQTAQAAQAQQMQQQMMAMQNRPREGAGMTEMLIAMMGNSKESAAAQMQQHALQQSQQQQAAQQQQQLLVTMMTKAGGGDKQVMELVKEMMNQKSPEMQAALMEAMMNMQVTMTGAMANLVRETMPDNPPVWLEAVMGGLGTVQNIAGEMFEESRARRTPPQAQMQQLQAPQAHQQLAQGQLPLVEVPAIVTPAPAVNGSPKAAEHLDAETQQRLEAAAKEVDGFAAFLPEDFRTQEWRAILIELRAQQPVERVAHLLTRHVGHLLEFRGLPELLADLPAQPMETLTGLLGQIPASPSEKDYLTAVIEQTVRWLREEGYVARAAEPVVEVAEPEGRSSGNGTAAEAEGVTVEPPLDLAAEVIPIGGVEA